MADLVTDEQKDPPQVDMANRELGLSLLAWTSIPKQSLLDQSSHYHEVVAADGGFLAAVEP